MAKHARLSASGSKQWINCPGSIRREMDYPQGGSTMFGMQGTAGHFVAAYCLGAGGDADDCLGAHIWVYDGEDKTKKDCYSVPEKHHGGKLEERLEAEGYTCFTVVDGEGNGELTELKTWALNMYINKVRMEHELACSGAAVMGMEEPRLTCEAYMDGSWLHPLMGGTADNYFLGFDNWVKLFDLKFGSGVSVEVEDNTQLMIYCVLILHLMREAGLDPEGVDMWIVQPRLAHLDGPIRHVQYTKAQLDGFRDELRELAERTQKRNAPINAGDWCLWCKAKIGCDEFKQRTQELAAMDFDDEPDHIVAPTDLNALARLARWLPMLDALNKDVEGAIARNLHQGRKVEGFKIVHKRTNRRFGDPETGEEVPEERIVELMKSEALVAEADLYHPRKLLTMPQMEKLGKDAKQALRAITFKPEGALTVAPDSDPREAIEIKVADFPDDLDEDLMP